MPTDEPEGPLSYRPLGVGEILAEGQDVLIIALGHMNTTALEVRDQLEKKGITATVSIAGTTTIMGAKRKIHGFAPSGTQRVGRGGS